MQTELEQLRLENQQLREELDKAQQAHMNACEELVELRKAYTLFQVALQPKGSPPPVGLVDNTRWIIGEVEKQLTSYNQSLGELLRETKRYHNRLLDECVCETCQAITRAEQLIKEANENSYSMERTLS